MAASDSEEFQYDEVTEFDAGGAIFNYDDIDFDGDGWLGGGEIGANFQSGPWVFGAEADIQLTDIEGDQTFLNSILRQHSICRLRYRGGIRA